MWRRGRGTTRSPPTTWPASRSPVVVEVDGSETIAIRSMMYLALSYDHRIVDGADAARFLTTVKQRLEDGNFEGFLGA